MPLRNRLFIIISIVVLIILGLAVALLITRKNSSPSKSGGNTTSTTQNTNGTTAEVSVVAANNTLPVQKLSSVEAQQVGVKQLARVFIERYYTYSSEGNFQNIRDVQTLVSPDLWNQLKQKIGPNTASAGAPFTGVTTVSLGATLGEWDASSASVTVLTHQTVDKNGSKTEKNQNYIVSFVKVDTNWLVNGVALPKE